MNGIEGLLGPGRSWGPTQVTGMKAILLSRNLDVREKVERSKEHIYVRGCECGMGPKTRADHRRRSEYSGVPTTVGTGRDGHFRSRVLLLAGIVSLKYIQ